MMQMLHYSIVVAIARTYIGCYAKFVVECVLIVTERLVTHRALTSPLHMLLTLAACYMLMLTPLCYYHCYYHSCDTVEQSLRQTERLTRQAKRELLPLTRGTVDK
jgi:hypothetical protein